MSNRVSEINGSVFRSYSAPFVGSVNGLNSGSNGLNSGSNGLNSGSNGSTANGVLDDIDETTPVPANVSRGSRIAFVQVRPI